MAIGFYTDEKGRKRPIEGGRGRRHYRVTGGHKLVMHKDRLKRSENILKTFHYDVNAPHAQRNRALLSALLSRGKEPVLRALEAEARRLRVEGEHGYDSAFVLQDKLWLEREIIPRLE